MTFARRAASPILVAYCKTVAQQNKGTERVLGDMPNAPKQAHELAVVLFCYSLCSLDFVFSLSGFWSHHHHITSFFFFFVMVFRSLLENVNYLFLSEVRPLFLMK